MAAKIGLADRLISRFALDGEREWVADVRVIPGGLVAGTIVSGRFDEKEIGDRERLVAEALHESFPGIVGGLRVGFMSLYTPDEAEALELSRHPPVASDQGEGWLALAGALAEGRSLPEKERAAGRPRIVTFYSYKGGVGRTTAMAHVAHELARRGRKVVLIDMDLEAPCLHHIFSIAEPATLGIVDYLVQARDGDEPAITQFFGEVRGDFRGRLFIVPAGPVTAQYIARVTSLHRDEVVGPGGAWERFVDALRKHLDPDLLIIDARTGINEWAELALLDVADDVFVVFFPNKQNMEGLVPVLDGLRLLGRADRVHLIASMYPRNEEGQRRAANHLAQLGERLYGAPVEEPHFLRIPYSASAALLETVPDPNAEALYYPAANLIDESTHEESLTGLFLGVDRRHVVDSLPFQEVKAEGMKPETLRLVFHRTSDFDKLLDGATCLVRGRKGTGKSVLYGLFLKHPQVALDLAGARLQGKEYRFRSGHGKAEAKPTAEEFLAFDRMVQDGRASWAAVWRAILLPKLAAEITAKPKGIDADLWRLVRSPELRENTWSAAHTDAVRALSATEDQSLRAKYAFDVLDATLAAKKREVWFFFDDLDEDLQAADPGQQQRVLAALFKLIQVGDSQQHKAIRFKVFLREDIWERLTFENKSHFHGRYVTLQWRREDVLRLALRQARVSPQFEEISRRFRPVSDVEMADEATLYNALEPLWGIRTHGSKSKYVYRWVYERLSDSRENFYPRAMQHLLIGAKDAELGYLGGASPSQAPRDRLLRMESLVSGLRKASHERLQELLEEYPELRAFVDRMNGLTSPVANEEVERRWAEANSPYGIEPKDAVRWMHGIGLMRDSDADAEPGKRQKIADLYLHGMKMSRSGPP